MSAKQQAQSSSLPEASNMKLGIVVAEWNEPITGSLHEGCLQTLRDQNVKDNNIESIHVPGSFELPAGAQFLGRNKDIDAVICLGCVIKGETRHDEYINHAVANALINLTREFNMPFIFGVLTTENEEQAKARAGGEKGNKGAESAEAAIKMVGLQQSFKHYSGGNLGF
jgi:6,7-dimethyl-8-ribityllumazine synthase